MNMRKYVLSGDCAVETTNDNNDADRDNTDNTNDQVKETNLQVLTLSRPMKSNVSCAGYVRNRETTLTPFSKAHVENVPKLIICRYGKYTTPRQYALTNLAIDLQNLIKSEDGQMHDVKHAGGMVDPVPSRSDIRRESKQ
jgi:hypothetical protein